MDDTAYLGYQRVEGQYTHLFGIKDQDRTSHVYLVGKTGAGKSVMLENMMVRDLAAHQGFAFIDPHGTAAQALLDHISPDRIQDVVYVNVADLEYPPGFNLLSGVAPDDRPLVADAQITTFKHIWEGLWDEGRMEYLTYHTIAALLGAKDPSLLRGLVALLSSLRGK